MSRGMTLLETVLALALLSALFASTGWWLREAASMRALTVEPLRFEEASRAALDRIGECIETGDLEVKDDLSKPRVRLIDGEFSIRTRQAGANGGPVIRSYRFDRTRGALFERTRPDGGRAINGVGIDEAVLVGGLKDAIVSIEAKKRVLTVELTSNDGTKVIRRYRAP